MKKINTIQIGARKVKEVGLPFIIAEAGVNHNNDVELGKELIRKAKESGADAIKFQNYKAGKLATRNAPRYWKEKDDPDGSQYDTFAKLDKLSETQYRELFDYAKKIGISCISTPFDNESADFLEELGVPAYKIASADITDFPLIEHVAKKNMPIILSTGMATVGEIEEAIKLIEQTGNREIALLHCTLSYPCAPRDANLRMMQYMMQVFPAYLVGLSDHTLGITVSLAAITLGARVIEKHFTVDKTLPGSPDHHLSIDPQELKELVKGAKVVNQAMGAHVKAPVKAESLALKYARRSIVAKRKISKGTILTENLLDFKRPGTGISPKHLRFVLGRKTLIDIDEDQVVEWQMI